MPNSPSTSFQTTDLTFGVDGASESTNGVQVTTKRGPIGAAATLLVSSWAQFEKIFGSLLPGNAGVSQVKRALERGSALRVSRVAHYTDPTDATSLTMETADSQPFYTVSLSDDIETGQTITFTQGVLTVSQVFTVSAAQTIAAFIAKLLNATFIGSALAIDTQNLVIAPNTSTDVVDVEVTGAGSLPTSTVTPNSAFKDSLGNSLFSFTGKYPGADYNNVVIKIAAPSSGRAGFFDILVNHKQEPSLNESYRNIRIIGKPNAVNSNYLDSINKQSNLIQVGSYSDLSGITTTTVVPVYNQIASLGAGTDGGYITAGDYIGDSGAKTGFNAFDGVDDILAVAILDDITGLAGVHQAGAAYAANRQDVNYFGHLVSLSESAIAAERNALNIDTSFARFFAGGVTWVNPQTSTQEVIPELGDILGISAYSAENFGRYRSFAGVNRGLIINAIGSGNNWGARGNKANLDLMAQAQVNVVIDRDNRTYLLGNFTAQLDYSQLSFGNVRDTVIYACKSLAPVVDRYLEEPCEPQTWKKLYLEVKPFLDGLTTQRALFDYRWEGDQFAKSVQQGDLKVNDAGDVSLGKYKVRLFLQVIESMQEIEVNVTLTPSSVSFEDALNLIQP